MKQQAIAIGKSMPISPKDTIEISNYIRGRSVERAITILEKAVKKEEPIPYRRFTNGIGHRRGNMANGRYPVLAARAIIKVIKSAQANAQVKGMNSENLIIAQAIPNRGSRSMHYGRKRGIQTKSTHLTIIVEESEVNLEDAKNKKKTAKKVAKKTEEKKESVEKAAPVEKKEEVAQEKKEKVTEAKKEESKEKPTPKKAAPVEKKEETKEKVEAKEEKTEEKKESKSQESKESPKKEDKQ